jgi:hypothetical protein
VFDAMAAAACGFGAAGALADMMGAATAEIETAADNSLPTRFDAINRAWLACSLMIVAGHSSAFCPAALSRTWCDLRRSGVGSWDSPAAPHEVRLRTDLNVNGAILDLHYRMLVAQTGPDANDLQATASKVAGWFDTADRLCAESAQFYFALQAANDWRFSPDYRAGLSRLWAGIESILGISTEISYRASLACAALLAPAGADRLSLYKSVRGLYNRRSKAVHGDKISAEHLVEAASESSGLLTRLLSLCLDLGKVPSPEDQERALLDSR